MIKLIELFCVIFFNKKKFIITNRPNSSLEIVENISFIVNDFYFLSNIISKEVFFLQYNNKIIFYV